jgi:hypothetical protein
MAPLWMPCEKAEAANINVNTNPLAKKRRTLRMFCFPPSSVELTDYFDGIPK